MLQEHIQSGHFNGVGELLKKAPVIPVRWIGKRHVREDLDFIPILRSRIARRTTHENQYTRLFHFVL
jgi:hypothetical protein